MGDPRMNNRTDYQQVLALQLAMTEQTLARLLELGLTPETEVRLDFFYHAANQEKASALHQLLCEQTDYDVEVASSGRFLLKKWSVCGQTQLTTVSPEILEGWISWMVAAGQECECVFDGWGTPVTWEACMPATS
jgi:hypothetical protein